MRKIVYEAQILEYMSLNLEVTMSALRETFPVSVPTLNRLLGTLKKHNWIKIEKDKVIYSPITYFNTYSMKDISAKINLARFAVNLIDDGNVIGLAGGSTTVSLMMPFLLLNKKNITVISNSLLALKYYLDLEYLAKENKVLLITLGGLLQSEGHAFGGEYVESIMANYRIDKNFVSTSSADINRGLFVKNLQDFAIEKQLMSISDENYVLCNSSKFRPKYIYKCSDWQDFNGVITDAPFTQSQFPASCKKFQV